MIDFKSIERKLSQFLKTPEVKREIEQYKDDIYLGKIKLKGNTHTPEEAARVFKEVLLRCIDEAASSYYFPDRLVEDLSDIAIDVVKKMPDGRYSVRVYFEQNLLRDSMSTLKSYYPIRLDELYNDGVDHVMPQIFETDKKTGVVRMSTTYIPASRYMETAISRFMNEFAALYDVDNIIVEGEDINSVRGIEYREYNGNQG